MKAQESHAHHYVPQWYQKRFLMPGQTNFYLLDLKPETIKWEYGTRTRKAVRRRGSSVCFFENDLYTLRFGKQTTDAMERKFFGTIDTLGHEAVSQFSEYDGIAKGARKAFDNLVPYMGAQRFRTPRGLDEIKQRATFLNQSQNAMLAALQSVFQAYTTMWVEGVWEIVRARQSPTKFIVTDAPVTFYCKKMFTSEWNYPNDPSLRQIGTRTLFPLGLDSCLIISHVQFTS